MSKVAIVIAHWRRRSGPVLWTIASNAVRRCLPPQGDRFQPAAISARHRIAVVDDDYSVRRALCRLLRSADLDTDAYGSGNEFLDTLKAAMPDCIVLDLQMPGLDGLELQQRLRESGISLPVVIVTGHDEPGMRARCLAAGASAYLHKPIDGGTLVEAINRAISQAPSPAC